MEEAKHLMHYNNMDIGLNDLNLHEMTTSGNFNHDLSTKSIHIKNENVEKIEFCDKFSPLVFLSKCYIYTVHI